MEKKQSQSGSNNVSSRSVSQFSQFSRSVVSNSLQPHESQHARPPCPSPTPGVLKLMCIELVMPSSHLIFCRPLLLLPPIPPSIRVFSNESTLRMRWPKYWSFSFNISPSNEHSGLISFRMDWWDLLAIQESRVDGFKPYLMLVILCLKKKEIVNNEQCTKLTASDIKVHSCH